MASKPKLEINKMSHDCHPVSLPLPYWEASYSTWRFSALTCKMKMQRLWPMFLSLATALVLAGANHATAQLLVNGAGATFPYPIYSKWFDEYSKVDPSVRFNYQSIGSGGGQQQILEGTVDFGASDGPMSDHSLAKASGKILHVPTVAGADVVTYNLPGGPRLRL